MILEDEIRPEIKRQIEIKLEQHMVDEDQRFEELKKDIQELKGQMQAFTEAWQQAKGVVTFLKWAFSLSGGITALIIFFKDHIK